MELNQGRSGSAVFGKLAEVDVFNYLDYSVIFKQ